MGRKTTGLIKRMTILGYVASECIKRLWVISDLKVGLYGKLPKVVWPPSLLPRLANLLHYMLRSEHGASSWSPLAPNRFLNSSHQRYSPGSRSFNHVLTRDLEKLEPNLCSLPDVISHCPSRTVHRLQGTGYLDKFSGGLATYTSSLSATETRLNHISDKLVRVY